MKPKEGAVSIERERRWLVLLNKVPVEVAMTAPVWIDQGYLSAPKTKPVVRIRLLRTHREAEPYAAVQTVKAPQDDGMAEVEFDVPLAAGVMLMQLRVGGLLKTRRTVPMAGGELKLELDSYQDDALFGMAIVEVELPSFDCPLVVPEWFGPEITHVRELSNVGLAFNPAAAWAAANAVWDAWNKK